MHLGEIIFTGSSLSAFAFVPLAALSFGSVVIMGLNETLNIKEKCYKFYNDMLLLYKQSEINKEVIYNKEREFLNNITYFAVEKY